MSPALPFKEVHFVGEHGLSIAEESDDDAKAYRGFRGSVRNNEEGEDLSSDIAENTREQHEIDIYGVEDEFDGHEDDDDVPARHNADATDQEQRQAEKQVMSRRHHGSPVLFLFLAITTAPTIATSSRTLAISNGRR